MVVIGPRRRIMPVNVEVAAIITVSIQSVGPNVVAEPALVAVVGPAPTKVVATLL